MRIQTKLLWPLALVSCATLGVAGLEASEIIIHKPGENDQKQLFLYAKVNPNTPREVKVNDEKVQITTENDKNGATAVTQLIRNGEKNDSGNIFKVESIPNSAQIILTTKRIVNEIAYFDGKSWFLAVGPFSANTKARLKPTVSDSLPNLGYMTKDETNSIGLSLNPQGPMAIASLPISEIKTKDDFNIEPLPRYFRKTLLEVQNNVSINTDGLSIPVWTQPKPVIPFNYQVLDRGVNANYSDSQPSYSVSGRKITVFAGVKPTLGYSISLLDVDFEEDKGFGATIYIDVQLNKPPSDAITAQVITSPYLTIESNKDFKKVRINWR